MKVLLVYPVAPRTHWPIGRMRSYWVPTGLAFLGAVLKRAGHTVRAHVREELLTKNALDWKNADAHLRSILEEFRPDVVGLSVLTPAVKDTDTIARWTKHICGEQVLVVAGGAHPTALPEQTLNECPAIDAVVLGEGEETLVELLEQGPHPEVAGLVYRKGEQLVHTGQRGNPRDLDSLGPPAYELFDMDFYTAPNRLLIRWLKLSGTNIRTSRGCTNRCRFCAGHVVAGVGVRFHSIEYVLDQLLNAVNRFGVQAIHFEDDTFGADRDRLLELCETMSRHDLHKRIQWDCCLRVDQADPELLRRMKDSGCIQIEYGFESGSSESLRRLGKNTGAELNRRAVRLTREANLRIFADIMLALPGETEKEFHRTVRFVRWMRAEVLGTGRLCPLPGTPIFDKLPPQLRESIDWADYTYLDRSDLNINLTAMPDERINELYRKFRKYLVRPQFTRALLRDTPREDFVERRRLIAKLVRFAVRHPIRAIRVPW